MIHVAVFYSDGRVEARDFLDMSQARGFAREYNAETGKKWYTRISRMIASHDGTILNHVYPAPGENLL